MSGFKYKEQYAVVVMCKDEKEQAAIYDRLKQEGYTLPDIYAIVREGFNIVGLERPAWWRFWSGSGANFTIRALKKNWKSLGGTYRPYV